MAPLLSVACITYSGWVPAGSASRGAISGWNVWGSGLVKKPSGSFKKSHNCETKPFSGYFECGSLSLAGLNQSLREAVLARVVVFVDGEMLMEQAWMLLW